jgi:hypothetical protein
VRRIRGTLWMIRRYGLRTWWRYSRARRAGVVVDYARLLTTDERAVIGEHATVPWEDDR